MTLPVSSFIPLRNAFVKALSEYLAVPVIASDQTAPEPDPPYIVYSVTSANIPIPNRGARVFESYSPDTVSDVRVDVMHATLSITCCSENRHIPADPDDPASQPRCIQGDDEAFQIAERAMAWLDHIGRHKLARCGLVSVETMNAQNRSGIVVDQAERRYGFDVRLRYGRAAGRTEPKIMSFTSETERS